MIVLRSLWRARIRSLSTVLAVAGGMAIFVVISSLTSGIRAEIIDTAEAYAGDVIVQQRRTYSPFLSSIPPDVLTRLQSTLAVQVSPMVLGSLRDGAIGLDMFDARAARSMQPVEEYHEEWSTHAFIVGMPIEMIRRIALVSGDAPAPGETHLMMGVLGAQRFDVVQGELLMLGGEAYRLAGIFRTGSRLLDYGIIAEISQAQRILGRDPDTGGYNLALVQVLNAQEARRAIDAVHREFPQLRAVASAEFAGTLRIFRAIQTFSGIIGFMALLGMCLVVSNTLAMAVAERTRDIGILMSIGWRPRKILQQLLSEALVLCTIGGVLGFLAGFATLYWISHIRASDLGWIPVGVSGNDLWAPAVVVVLVALVSCVVPAFAILRLRPVVALRAD